MDSGGNGCAERGGRHPPSRPLHSAINPLATCPQRWGTHSFWGQLPATSRGHRESPPPASTQTSKRLQTHDLRE